jgi:uncharacterized membrane protein YsdA (DUF1294 family)
MDTKSISGVGLFILLYVAAVSVAGVALTVYDKIISKKNTNGKGRVPENTLMYLGVMGGALPMFITMLIFRHKTRHKKFMVGLPVMFILHIIIAVFLIAKGLI